MIFLYFGRSARHGHQLSGKLKRVAEQETGTALTEEEISEDSQEGDVVKKTRNVSEYKEDCVGLADLDCCNNKLHGATCLIERKEKVTKKKRKRKESGDFWRDGELDTKTKKKNENESEAKKKKKLKNSNELDLMVNEEQCGSRIGRRTKGCNGEENESEEYKIGREMLMQENGDNSKKISKLKKKKKKERR